MKSASGKAPNKAIITILVIAALGLGAAISYHCLRLYCGWPKPYPLEFSSEEWKKGELEVRGRMTRDLFEKYDSLKGMKRKEIVELLGEPDREEPPNVITYDAVLQPSWVSFRRLGPLRVDLDILFNEDDVSMGCQVNG